MRSSSHLETRVDEEHENIVDSASFATFLLINFLNLLVAAAWCLQLARDQLRGGTTNIDRHKRTQAIACGAYRSGEVALPGAGWACTKF